MPRVCEYSVKSQRTAHRGSPWCPQQWGSPNLGTSFNVLAAGVTVICRQPPIILEPPTVAQHHRTCSCCVGALLVPTATPGVECTASLGTPWGPHLQNFEICDALSHHATEVSSSCVPGGCRCVLMSVSQPLPRARTVDRRNAHGGGWGFG